MKRGETWTQVYLRTIRICGALPRHFFQSLPPHRASHLIKIAQANAKRLARFNRKEVFKHDWMDESLPFRFQRARSIFPPVPPPPQSE